MMVQIAASTSTSMLIFHIVALLFLLSIYGLLGTAALLALSVPVVEMWQGCKEAVCGLPDRLSRLAVTCGIRIGLIDPVALELLRIDRIGQAALDDIARLHREAIRAIELAAGEDR